MRLHINILDKFMLEFELFKHGTVTKRYLIFRINRFCIVSIVKFPKKLMIRLLNKNLTKLK